MLLLMALQNFLVIDCGTEAGDRMIAYLSRPA